MYLINIFRKCREKLRQKCFEWQLKNAEAGYAQAQYDIGVRYAQGHGVKLNSQKAFKWLKKAALQGHIGAQYHMGLCFLDGEGTKADPKKAFTWFKKAADQGHVEAIKFINHMKV